MSPFAPRKGALSRSERRQYGNLAMTTLTSRVRPDVHQRAADLVAAQRDMHSLDQPFYADPELFELDVRARLPAALAAGGHVSRIPQPGDYFLYEMAGESIIVIRDRQGEIQALFNVCTHRGSRICSAETGQAPVLVCPYHAWTFNRMARSAARGACRTVLTGRSTACGAAR